MNRAGGHGAAGSGFPPEFAARGFEPGEYDSR